jgi:glycosidase
MSDGCMKHEARFRRFVNKLDSGRVRLQLVTECDELESAQVVWRVQGREQIASLEPAIAALDHRQLAVELPAAERVEYVFRLRACGCDRWVTPVGVHLNHQPPAAWFTYDPAAHTAFPTPDWVRDAVFYQIFPDRFCNGDRANDPPGAEAWGRPPHLRNFFGGDLAGILQRLDHLGDLGVTALYLTPIFESASNHKYDTIDYFKVDPHFGDLALVQKLVAECHRRGMRVILDAVFNHTSNLHPFFRDVRLHGPRSRYWDWYHIKQWPIPDRFTKHQEALAYYNCWWGFHTLPQLNYVNPAVEEYFLKVATYWLRETGMDGWRLDVPNEVLQSFWPKFRQAVKGVNPEAYIVGEIWEDATQWLQGDQFDAVMNYRFQKALLQCFAENKLTLRELDQALRQILMDYPSQAMGVMLNLLGSHDTPRIITAAGGDVAAVKMMATIQFAFAGAPCIYYGDEIGLPGEKDPDCRRCYPWDQPDEQNRELYRHFQQLIALRRDNPALRSGAFQTLLVDDSRDVYAFERRLPGNACRVAVNRGAQAQTVAGRELPARTAAIWPVA